MNKLLIDLDILKPTEIDHIPAKFLKDDAPVIDS